MTVGSVSGLPLGAALDSLTKPQAAPLPRAGQSTLGSAEIVKAAHHFEAMAIAQLLKPMFSSVGSAQAPFGGGSVEKSFRPFFIDAIAKSIEARGGLGLAPMIERALEADQQKAKMSSGATSHGAASPAPSSSTGSGS
ncbi:MULTISPECIES: rod-binding protein [unclassified Acidiphilium]|uniref:rod-binding protein n=1 Tax=unclassified Acidiphilium TaxID=2617493 RepID=UPI000586DFF7|nr:MULTISPECIES: rod-binding protein [unclassified Acidiphilium]